MKKLINVQCTEFAQNSRSLGRSGVHKSMP